MTTTMQPARERPDLSDLTPEQIAPLEALLPEGFPDTWRDFARSHFLTLLWLHTGRAPVDLAAEAIELTRGIAQDMGGSQPYIPTGFQLASSAKMQRVIQLLADGMGYSGVARATGLTERRVRRIESAWRAEQLALRQGRLEFA
jgi:hypothetical protein